MKASIVLTLCLCITFGFHSKIFGKDHNKTQPKSEKTEEPKCNIREAASSTEGQQYVIPESTSKTDDIVVNMEMINSFRRCYDRIEVIPWADLIRNTESSDWGVAYMAYRRLSFKTSADSTTDIAKSLALEMEKVREDIDNNPDSLSISHITKSKRFMKGKIIIVKKEETEN